MTNALVFDFVHNGDVANLQLLSDKVSLVYEAHRHRPRYPLVWDEVSDRVVDASLPDDAQGIILERRYRSRLFKREIGLILEGFVFAANDILKRFCVHTSTRFGWCSY